jgi:alkylation response protein AidB-like acyl-CoA dehydrogenase
MRLSLEQDERDLALGLRGRLGREDDLDHLTLQQILAGLGLFGLEMPGIAGGLEMGLGNGVIVCEELGRQAAPDGYRASALLGDILADEHEFKHLLGRVVTGDAAAAAAGLDAPVRLATHGDRAELTGSCLTPDPVPADYLLIPFGGARDRGIAVVAGDDPGVVVGQGQPAEIRLEAARRLVVMSFVGSTGRRVLDRARIRQAAYLLGLAVGAIEEAKSRAVSRRQFGRPIGENQAVAFALARHYAESEAVRLLLHKAAWLADRDAAGSLAATQALAYSAELALDATAWAVHLHGASGLTRGKRVHLYYQCAAREAVRWGTPAELWDEAARPGRDRS